MKRMNIFKVTSEQKMYKATHPGYYKQDIALVLAIFDETTSVAIRIYFSEKIQQMCVLH